MNIDGIPVRIMILKADGTSLDASASPDSGGTSSKWLGFAKTLAWNCLQRSKKSHSWVSETKKLPSADSTTGGTTPSESDKLSFVFVKCHADQRLCLVIIRSVSTSVDHGLVFRPITDQCYTGWGYPLRVLVGETYEDVNPPYGSVQSTTANDHPSHVRIYWEKDAETGVMTRKKKHPWLGSILTAGTKQAVPYGAMIWRRDFEDPTKQPEYLSWRGVNRTSGATAAGDTDRRDVTIYSGFTAPSNAVFIHRKTGVYWCRPYTSTAYRILAACLLTLDLEGYQGEYVYTVADTGFTRLEFKLSKLEKFKKSGLYEAESTVVASLIYAEQPEGFPRPRQGLSFAQTLRAYQEDGVPIFRFSGDGTTLYGPDPFYSPYWDGGFAAIDCSNPLTPVSGTINQLFQSGAGTETAEDYSNQTITNYNPTKTLARETVPLTSEYPAIVSHSLYYLDYSSAPGSFGFLTDKTSEAAADGTVGYSGSAEVAGSVTSFAQKRTTSDVHYGRYYHITQYTGYNQDDYDGLADHGKMEDIYAMMERVPDVVANITTESVRRDFTVLGMTVTDRADYSVTDASGSERVRVSDWQSDAVIHLNIDAECLVHYRVTGNSTATGPATAVNITGTSTCELVVNGRVVDSIGETSRTVAGTIYEGPTTFASFNGLGPPATDLPAAVGTILNASSGTTTTVSETPTVEEQSGEYINPRTQAVVGTWESTATTTETTTTLSAERTTTLSGEYTQALFSRADFGSAISYKYRDSEGEDHTVISVIYVWPKSDGTGWDYENPKIYTEIDGEDITEELGLPASGMPFLLNPGIV
jgi:hypothetical protein